MQGLQARPLNEIIECFLLDWDLTLSTPSPLTLFSHSLYLEVLYSFVLIIVSPDERKHAIAVFLHLAYSSLWLNNRSNVCTCYISFIHAYRMIPS